jgi:hypothetical protein
MAESLPGQELLYQQERERFKPSPNVRGNGDVYFRSADFFNK